MRGGRAAERPFAQLDFEYFEVVARLEVVRVGQHDTAFEAGAHFGDIVLEAAERRDRRRRDDDVLARETRVEPLADRAFEHEQARGLVQLDRREDVLHLGAAAERFAACSAEESRGGEAGCSTVSIWVTP